VSGAVVVTHCQYKKPEYNRKSIAAMADYPEFIKNVNIVVEKVMHELELEFLPPQG